VTELSDAQRAGFARDGYVVIPGIADRAHIDTALQLLNSWLFGGFDSTQRITYYAQTFAPELAADPRILGLLTETGALALAAQLVGRPIVMPDRAQIALRFPVPPGRPPFVAGAHVDGVPTEFNGVPSDGHIHGFTVLAGILLSDLSGPDQGNVTVWPRTHLAMADWFAEHGTEVTDPGAFDRATEEVAAATSEPVALTGRAGDLLLAHHLLAHANGAHTGPNVRYEVFYRLSTDVRDDLGDAVLTDPWAEWAAFRR
jgi:hypothetical protein